MKIVQRLYGLSVRPTMTAQASGAFIVSGIADLAVWTDWLDDTQGWMNREWFAWAILVGVTCPHNPLHG